MAAASGMWQDGIARPASWSSRHGGGGRRNPWLRKRLRSGHGRGGRGRSRRGGRSDNAGGRRRNGLPQRRPGGGNPQVGMAAGGGHGRHTGEALGGRTRRAHLEGAPGGSS